MTIAVMGLGGLGLRGAIPKRKNQMEEEMEHQNGHWAHGTPVPGLWGFRVMGI